jgi:hypothetical protein
MLFFEEFLQNKEFFQTVWIYQPEDCLIFDFLKNSESFHSKFVNTFLVIFKIIYFLKQENCIPFVQTGDLHGGMKQSKLHLNNARGTPFFMEYI